MHTDSLLYQLYSRPDDAAQWTSVLNQLCRETGAQSAVLQAVKRSAAGLTIAWSAADSYTLSRDATPPAGIGDTDNPRMEARRFARGLNRICRDEELFERGDPAERRLHEQLAQRRLGRFMGSLHQLADDTYLGLALHRAIDDPQNFSSDHASQLAMLTPHFGQAMALRTRLRGNEELDRQLRGHLHRMRGGLIVCDGQARVQWINQRAQTLMEVSSALRLRAGILCAADARLHRHITELAAGANGNRYLTLGEGRECLHLALQADSAGVLLAVTEVAADVPVPADAIAALFGLTRAEACLVAGLVAGSSLEQYAQRRGVGLGTVRGQLKQVQAKTGATRQAELVRLVLSSAAAQLPAPVPASPTPAPAWS